MRATDAMYTNVAVLLRRYGGLGAAALQSFSQQNSMYGMGGGSNAQLMQQLYRGAAAGSPDPWSQQTNSLLAAGGEEPLNASVCRGRPCPLHLRQSLQAVRLKSIIVIHAPASTQSCKGSCRDLRWLCRLPQNGRPARDAAASVAQPEHGLAGRHAARQRWHQHVPAGTLRSFQYSVHCLTVCAISRCEQCWPP